MTRLKIQAQIPVGRRKYEKEKQIVVGWCRVDFYSHGAAFSRSPGARA
jgi:hypothetical protein